MICFSLESRTSSKIIPCLIPCSISPENGNNTNSWINFKLNHSLFPQVSPSYCCPNPTHLPSLMLSASHGVQSSWLPYYLFLCPETTRRTETLSLGEFRVGTKGEGAMEDSINDQYEKKKRKEKKDKLLVRENLNLGVMHVETGFSWRKMQSSVSSQTREELWGSLPQKDGKGPHRAFSVTIFYKAMIKTHK